MIALGLLIPFIGTTLGSAMVFFMRKSINPKLEKILLGFAAGVMMAASVWSLLIPSIEMSSDYRFEFIPAAIGFLTGIIFLLLLDAFIPHLNYESRTLKKIKNEKIQKTAMMILAVTLHNIPEGMAVGLAFALAAKSEDGVMLASAIALAVGMGIQNFPEGAAIALPMRQAGRSRTRAFLCGAASGIVEPIFALVTVLIAGTVQVLLPWLLSFAAGAMLYVVVEELIPEAHLGDSHIGTLGVMIGFIVMMTLDVAL